MKFSIGFGFSLLFSHGDVNQCSEGFGLGTTVWRVQECLGAQGFSITTGSQI